MMFGYEIIQELTSFLTGDELVVSSNGNISRQAYHYLPQPQIYLRGSMGLPVSVGLGLALARPEKQILILVGDGNLLMGLGSLATASFIRPKNLKILIIDNNAYATTGHQRTASGSLDYPSLLNGFGIHSIESIQKKDSIDVVKSKMQEWLSATELCVLAALVASNPPSLTNIPWHPEQISEFQRKEV
jgi:sulfopyruvate decarboxylase subunit beta